MLGSGGLQSVSISLSYPIRHEEWLAYFIQYSHSFRVVHAWVASFLNPTARRYRGRLLPHKPLNKAAEFSRCESGLEPIRGVPELPDIRIVTTDAQRGKSKGFVIDIREV